MLILRLVSPPGKTQQLPKTSPSVLRLRNPILQIQTENIPRCLPTCLQLFIIRAKPSYCLWQCYHDALVPSPSQMYLDEPITPRANYKPLFPNNGKSLLEPSWAPNMYQPPFISGSLTQSSDHAELESLRCLSTGRLNCNSEKIKDILKFSRLPSTVLGPEFPSEWFQCLKLWTEATGVTIIAIGGFDKCKYGNAARGQKQPFFGKREILPTNKVNPTSSDKFRFDCQMLLPWEEQKIKNKVKDVIAIYVADCENVFVVSGLQFILGVF